MDYTTVEQLEGEYRLLLASASDSGITKQLYIAVYASKSHSFVSDYSVVLQDAERNYTKRFPNLGQAFEYFQTL